MFEQGRILLAFTVPVILSCGHPDIRQRKLEELQAPYKDAGSLGGKKTISASAF